MFKLVFDGYIEVKYPNELLTDWKELLQKHNAYYCGKHILQNLGEFVDCQEDLENTEVEVQDNKPEENG